MDFHMKRCRLHVFSRITGTLAVLCFGLFSACSSNEVVEPAEPLLLVPEGFPAPGFPVDNAFSEDRWALGKKLFFDPVLSVDSTISCASCHRPQLAFSDDQAVSLGVEGRAGTRNAPSLANVAYQPYLLREGGVPTLEMQILVPIQEHAEFDFNILLIADRLQQDSVYVRMSRQAYSRDPDPFVITRAIATFERSLLSGDSRYDAYAHGKLSDLSIRENLGMQLFFSERLACSVCHAGFNFTDYSFQNNGLYDSYPDPGRFRLTGDEADRALFKVPSLRNVAVTGPYMHDGSVPTLEAVIEHYDSGGANHPHKSPLIRPLHLTSGEKQALAEFLRMLTDDHFITNSKFRP